MKKKTYREMYNEIEKEHGERGIKSFENAIKSIVRDKTGDENFDLNNVTFEVPDKKTTKKTSKKKEGK